MSKNGSRSALKFPGKKWGLSTKNRSDFSVFLAKPSSAVEETEEDKERLFSGLTLAFDIQKRNPEIFPRRHEILKAIFMELNAVERRRTVRNIGEYKLYCNRTGGRFTLENYLASPMSKVLRKTRR